MPFINFFTEDISFNLKQKKEIKSWLQHSIKSEGAQLNELNFIFCNDEYLLQINQKYLNHSNFTDIITFDNSEIPGVITGDIFISIDRIRENCLKYKVAEKDELHRVMIHGLLHLLGFKDKTKPQKALMTSKENHYLILRNL